MFSAEASLSQCMTVKPFTVLSAFKYRNVYLSVMLTKPEHDRRRFQIDTNSINARRQELFRHQLGWRRSAAVARSKNADTFLVLDKGDKPELNVFADSRVVQLRCTISGYLS